MSPCSPDDHHHHTKKKRVGKACDLCRIKKTKCDGKKPCSKCIADNKLCAFTDKKKAKEKAHPSGYIDLLETRLDLLTRLLDRIVLMAAPHLPFLQELMVRARAEHAEMLPGSDHSELRDVNYVPINEVVSYLISDMGLLDKAPLEWERGALIAANLGPTNVQQLALDFANHKRQAENMENGDSVDDYVKDSPVEFPFKTEDDFKTDLTYKPELSDFKSEFKPVYPRFHSRTSLSASVDSPSFDSALDLLLQHPHARLFTNLDNFPKRANLLFLSTDIASSTLLVSSLANRFESQDLDDSIRRKGLFKGPLSPSHQKMKQNGHVHKRCVQSHGHGNALVSNKGNEFHFPKQFVLSGSLPDVSSGLSKSLEVPSTVFDDDFLFDDLPSRFDDEFKTGLLGEELLAFGQ